MTPSTPPFPVSSPTVGRTVLVKGHRSNGSDVHPGVVTRAWSQTCVNLTLFPDYAAPLPCGSVEFRQTEAEADDMIASGYTGLVAYWPTRS